MSDREHAAMLLAMARKDLGALIGMVDDAATFADEVFGFHAQQVVEKATKAWLGLLGKEYPRTHDLEQLFLLVEEAGEELPDDFGELVDLTDFAVQFRYEAFEDLESEVDRPALARRVEAFSRYVQDQLEAVSGEPGTDIPG